LDAMDANDSPELLASSLKAINNTMFLSFSRILMTELSYVMRDTESFLCIRVCLTLYVGNCTHEAGFDLY
jgi:hypothetical protein